MTRRPWAEAVTAGLALAGWALLALGCARWTGAPAIVWPLAAGVLALSLVGWRLLLAIALHGLYTLTRDDRDA